MLEVITGGLSVIADWLRQTAVQIRNAVVEEYECAEMRDQPDAKEFVAKAE